jgi:hypothetical protein
MSTNYANIMGDDSSGQVTGIGNVLKVGIFLPTYIRKADMVSSLDCY